MLALVVGLGVVTAVAALLIGRGVGWRRALPGWLLVWSVLCLFVITLTPAHTSTPPIRFQELCSFDYGGPAPDGFWIVPGGQRLLNTLVFMPSGFFLVWLSAQFRRGLWWVLPGAVGLIGCSVLIETVQQKVSRLGRACDITDVVDNGVGTLVGVVIGLVVVATVGPVRRVVRRGSAS